MYNKPVIMTVNNYFMPDRTFFLVGMLAAAEAISAAGFPSAADIEG
jgi:hypothetical protein